MKITVACLLSLVLSPLFAQEDSFVLDPWFSEMKCSARGMSFDSLTAVSASKGVTGFGEGVKTLVVDWKGSSEGFVSLVYTSESKRLALKSPYAFDYFPASISEIAKVPSPNAMGVAASLPRISYLAPSVGNKKVEVARFMGFPEEWKVGDLKMVFEGMDERRRMTISASGVSPKGTDFALECGGMFSMPGRDVGTTDPDMRLDGFDVFDSPSTGGKRLGRIAGSKRLSEWEEERR